MILKQFEISSDGRLEASSKAMEASTGDDKKESRDQEKNWKYQIVLCCSEIVGDHQFHLHHELLL